MNDNPNNNNETPEADIPEFSDISASYDLELEILLKKNQQKKANQKRPAAPPPPDEQVPEEQPPVEDTSSTRLHKTVNGEKALPVPPEKQPKNKKTDKKPDKERHNKKRGGNTIASVIKAVIYMSSVTIIGILLAFFLIIPIGNDVFALVKDDAPVDITIPENATLSDVADILHEHKIIEYPKIFKMYAKSQNDDGVFMPGDYTEISPAMNYRELLRVFKPSSGAEIVSITIPEGTTTDDIIDIFIKNGIGTKEGFAEAINNYDFSKHNYWFIDELTKTGYSEERYYRLDGYLYPDTYFFYTTSAESTVLVKLLDNFEIKFDETYRQRAAELGMTVDELITLASIVESETRRPSELELVSSVFHNRMKNKANFPCLESDATIMYAIRHTSGARPDRLKPEDTAFDSAYNSYTNPGLPPGPISNPGYNAITFALYPAETKYYYFVANDAGESYFSKTLKEHQDAINKIISERNASQ